MTINLYIPPKERTGLIFLVLLIILTHAAYILYEKVFGYTEKERLEILADILEQNTLNSKQDTLIMSSSKTKNEGIPFDPNTVAYEQLIRLGIKNYAAKNLIKYREAGGLIHGPEDLYKIYGIDSGLVKSISYLIKIPKSAALRAPHPKEQNTASPLPLRQTDRSSLETAQKFFDPNTADFKTLKSHGFSNFAANNLIKYIRNGGRIEKDSQLLRVYGIDTLAFNRIINIIKIEPIKPIRKDSINHNKLSEKNNLIKKAFVSIDLNTATEEDLLKIKGIGPYLSKAIIDYRERLGGFVDVLQLKEVFAMRPETYMTIYPQFSISTDVQKMYIPDLSFKEILRHPYIDYETTKVLKNIPLTEFDIRITELINENIIDTRAIPYLYLNDPFRPAKVGQDH